MNAANIKGLMAKRTSTAPWSEALRSTPIALPPLSGIGYDLRLSC